MTKSSDMSMLEPTQRFSDRAGDYVVGRPSYPDEAISELFEGLGDPRELTVVDLGAGTGISSRLLAARAGRTVAIEPNAQMRAKAAPAANLIWQDGTAEATGLADGSIDVVTAFQAFHWFDALRAMAEMERILRPGGRAAILYNERDECDTFTQAYGEIVRRFSTDETESRRGSGREAFEAYPAWIGVRVLEFPNEQRLDAAALHARAASTSYLPHVGTAAEELHAALDTLIFEYASRAQLTMRMRTILSIAQTGPR